MHEAEWFISLSGHVCTIVSTVVAASATMTLSDLPLWTSVLVSIGVGLVAGVIAHLSASPLRRKTQERRISRKHRFTTRELCIQIQEWLVENGYKISRRTVENDYELIVASTQLASYSVETTINIGVPGSPETEPLFVSTKVPIDEKLGRKLSELDGTSRGSRLVSDMRIHLTTIGAQIQSLENPFEMLLWEQIDESFSKMWLMKKIDIIERSWILLYEFLGRELGEID